jgi:hypothetical protein
MKLAHFGFVLVLEAVVVVGEDRDDESSHRVQPFGSSIS